MMTNKYFSQLDTQSLKKMIEYVLNYRYHGQTYIDYIIAERNANGINGYKCCYTQNYNYDRDNSSTSYVHVSEFLVTDMRGVRDDEKTKSLRILMQTNKTFGKEYLKELKKIEALEYSARVAQQKVIETIKAFSETDGKNDEPEINN